jgi:hypothetical protein
MKLLKILILTIITVALVGSVAVRADEEGQDYGYWCTQCGRQHGPGESCPASSAPSSAPDEPYDWSQPVYTPATTTTTLKREPTSAELNEEGETLFNQGKYDEAYNKFWQASFGDDTPLYHDNLLKAKYALERQQEEKKQQQAEARKKQAELAKKMPVTHKKIKNIQPFGTSVVDLRDKQGALVVDPKALKEGSSRPKLAPVQPPPSLTKPQPKASAAILQDLNDYGELSAQQMLEMTISLGPRARKRIFARNPELPLINPLREPERYQAWEAAEKQRLADQAAEKKYRALRQAMADDKDLKAAADRIVKEEAKTVGREQGKIWDDSTRAYRDLKKQYDIKNNQELDKKLQSDQGFRQKMQAVADDYVQKSDANRTNGQERSIKQFLPEIAKFYQRHPEFNKKL